MAIPSGTTDFRTKGTLGEVEDIEMTIDEKGFKFLMSILTNLYEYPVLAVIREYCTNAVDAHIDAGYEGPVEVTLPTYDKRTFIVRDYGPGMDLEDIRNTYSKYVASTKRQDNTQAGMFGIGAKSALALGDMFTVESIKNGKKIVVMVQRKGRGEASMKVLTHNMPTTERNGTTIKVPADAPNRFAQQANRFFPYIKKGVFEVDGEDRGETFEGQKVADDLYALPSNLYGSGTSYIVMGNVPYPVETTERRRVVKYVEPGTFEPTPPREALEQTKGFMHTIKGYLDEAAEGLAKSVSEAVKDMTPSDASDYITSKYKLLNEWNALKHVEYDGHKMGDDFKYDGAARIMGGSSFDANGTCQFWDYFLGGHIIDFDGGQKDITKYTCQKAISGRGLVDYPRTMFLHYKGNKPKYAGNRRLVKWDRIREYSVNSRTNYGPSVHKAGDDWKVPTRQVSYVHDNTPKFPKSRTKVVDYAEWKGDDDSRDLVYFSPTDLDSQTKVNLYNTLFQDDEVFVVIKYTNQHDKTKRENPEAIHINDYGETLAKRLVAKHGQEAFISIMLPRMWDKIKGKQFDKARDFAKKPKKADISRNEREMVRTFAKDALTIEAEYAKLRDEILEDYPLIRNIQWDTDVEAVNIYIEAIDNYRKEEA